MGILDTLRKDNNEVENTVEETQTSDVSAEQANPQESVEETQTVDRAAYNCPDCNGQGLTADQTARCATCGGTGKI